MDIIYVEWLDSQGSGRWQDLQEVIDETKPRVIRSVGWLAHETDDAILLIQNTDMPNHRLPDVMNHIMILKVAITRRLVVPFTEDDRQAEVLSMTEMSLDFGKELLRSRIEDGA